MSVATGASPKPPNSSVTRYQVNTSHAAGSEAAAERLLSAYGTLRSGRTVLPSPRELLVSDPGNRRLAKKLITGGSFSSRALHTSGVQPEEPVGQALPACTRHAAFHGNAGGHIASTTSSGGTKGFPSPLPQTLLDDPTFCRSTQQPLEIHELHLQPPLQFRP